MVFCKVRKRDGKTIIIKWTTNFNPKEYADVVVRATHYDEARLADNILESDKILYLQADGNELVYIKHLFINIPLVERPMVTWYGEMAEFIARNL